MTLKLNVESLDSVDEALRPLYVEKDGKFALNVEGIEDTSALKGALQKERQAREAREKQIKAWDKLGKTPDELAEMLAAEAERAVKEAEGKGEWDKIRQQMNEKHQAEIAKREEALGSMRSMIQAKVIDAQAIADIAAEGGVPDLLLPHVQRFVKTDDNFSPVVVDASGTHRVDIKGNPMSIRDLVREMKASEVFGRAFNGSGQSGSGMPPPNGNAGGTPAIIKSKADIYKGIPEVDKKGRDKARAKFVETHGSQAYFALPG